MKPDVTTIDAVRFQIGHAATMCVIENWISNMGLARKSNLCWDYSRQCWRFESSEESCARFRAWAQTRLYINLK